MGEWTRESLPERRRPATGRRSRRGTVIKAEGIDGLLASRHPSPKQVLSGPHGAAENKGGTADSLRPLRAEFVVKRRARAVAYRR